MLTDSVECRWCGLRRGVLHVETPNDGPYGILFCPRCDWAHDHGDAGPPCGDRIKDVRP